MLEGTSGDRLVYAPDSSMAPYNQLPRTVNRSCLDIITVTQIFPSDAHAWIFIIISSLALWKANSCFSSSPDILFECLWGSLIISAALTLGICVLQDYMLEIPKRLLTHLWTIVFFLKLCSWKDFEFLCLGKQFWKYGLRVSWSRLVFLNLPIYFTSSSLTELPFQILSSTAYHTVCSFFSDSF